METEQRLQYIDPHSYGHQRCVFLVLQCCSTGGPGAQLSAECWLSLPHLVSDFSGPQLPDFLSSPSYIIVQSPTQSLEWHVWSSSSGNNCHAVQRSLSSGESVYECNHGIFTLSHFISQIHLRDFFRLLCHFLLVHQFGIACLAGSKVKIQQLNFDRLCKLMDFKNRTHLCLKVSKRQWKYHVNHMNGILEAIVTISCVDIQKYI